MWQWSWMCYPRVNAENMGPKCACCSVGSILTSCCGLHCVWRGRDLILCVSSLSDACTATCSAQTLGGLPGLFPGVASLPATRWKPSWMDAANVRVRLHWPLVLYVTGAMVSNVEECHFSLCAGILKLCGHFAVNSHLFIDYNGM